MRTIVLTLAAAIGATILGACDETNGGKGPQPGNTSSSSLMVWTANLEHLLPEHDWTTFVDRVSSAPRAPDLVFLTELT
ncbi:MAG: hypothetical protein M3174_02350, partial [Actinomycetota bacterium]|nr:hypothetical protein [Actinomycetota bacterium]